MKPSFVSLGLRSLWRDLRAGELRLLIVAVTLAVAALTAVGFFADRIKGASRRSDDHRRRAHRRPRERDARGQRPDDGYRVQDAGKTHRRVDVRRLADVLDHPR